MSRRSDPARTRAPAGSLNTERAAFISRLQSILRHWPSADRLARATGVSPSAFRKWLRGEAEPSRERLVALAQAAGVGVGWLAGGEGPEPRLKRLADSGAGVLAVAGGLADGDFVLLPRRPEAAAAGAEAPPSPNPAAFVAFRRDWILAEFGIDPDRLLVETAVGDSMEPGILAGDLLLVDTSEDRFRSFGIYVLVVAGERLVKRVQPKLDGSLTLISDNAAYEVDHIPLGDASGVRVVGRVLWTCGPPRGSR